MRMIVGQSRQQRCTDVEHAISLAGKGEHFGERFLDIGRQFVIGRGEEARAIE
jgi:hypothetical protein